LSPCFPIEITKTEENKGTNLALQPSPWSPWSPWSLWPLEAAGAKHCPDESSSQIGTCFPIELTKTEENKCQSIPPPRSPWSPWSPWPHEAAGAKYCPDEIRSHLSPCFPKEISKTEENKMTPPAAPTAQVALAARSRWCCASSVSPELGSFACLDTSRRLYRLGRPDSPRGALGADQQPSRVGSAPTGQFRILYWIGFGPAPPLKPTLDLVRATP